MIVSHQDSDHSGGALSLWSRADRLARFLAAGGRRSARACRAGETRASLRRGRTLGLGWRAVPLLHPVAANYADPKLKANDLSCVLRVSSAAGSALLTGDIEARTEAT